MIELPAVCATLPSRLAVGVDVSRTTVGDLEVATAAALCLPERTVQLSVTGRGYRQLTPDGRADRHGARVYGRRARRGQRARLAARRRARCVVWRCRRRCSASSVTR